MRTYLVSMKIILISVLVLLIIICLVVYICFIPKRRMANRKTYNFLWGVIRDKVDGFKEINEKFLIQNTKELFFGNTVATHTSTIVRVFEAKHYSLDIEPVYQWIKNAIRYRNGVTGFRITSMKRVSRECISFEFSDEDFIYSGLIQQQRASLWNDTAPTDSFRFDLSRSKHNLIAFRLSCRNK